MYRLNKLVEGDLTEFRHLMDTKISANSLMPLLLDDDNSIPVEYIALALRDNLKFTKNCPKYSIFERLEDGKAVMSVAALEKYIEVSQLGQEIMDNFKGSILLDRAVTVLFAHTFDKERQEE